MWQIGDLVKAEEAAKVRHFRLGKLRLEKTLTQDEARTLANALKLIRRAEKISEEEIWARRHAKMAF